jgi:kelch-like protein 2/3
MEARRSTLGVAVLNDCIYAVGGFDGSTGLNSAEVLDLSVASPMMQYVAGYLEGPHLQSDPNRRRREWRPIANMSTRRSSVGVGVLGSLIYAVGGYDGNSRQCLASVEVYIPEQDAWKRVADMSARRSGAAVGVLNGLLYSVGGHDGPLVRKSVECYNPDRDEWTNVSEMNYCRRNAGVVTHNGLLYVIGGDDGSSNLQSVEAYSPKTDSWTVLPASMSLGRSYTGVCVIDKPESI